jgi:hypothetical protein
MPARTTVRSGGVFAAQLRQFYRDGTNPAHLSGLSHLDSFIMTRKFSSIYRDFAKTHANPDMDGNCPYRRAVSKHIATYYPMKKLLFILVSLLLLNSCRTKGKRVTVDELIVFGYSGFCMKDSLNIIYPSGYWHYNETARLEFDSTLLDIRQYFEFKKDSFIKIAKRLPMKQTEYCSILPNDTNGLTQLINNTLMSRRFKADYDFPDSSLIMYDGWHYTLYCKESNNKDFLINYVPECLPDSLRYLHDFVTKIIGKSEPSKTQFKFDSIVTIVAKRLFKRYPPPPLPSNIEQKYNLK